MKKLIVIAALAIGCITNIANSLFKDQPYGRSGLVRSADSDAVAGSTWQHRDKYYRGPRDGDWSDRRNYQRGYVRTDAYPASNREYYGSDGYTRY